MEIRVILKISLFLLIIFSQSIYAEWKYIGISGGTGGLGLLTARWLAQTGAAQALVLVSRGGVLASDMASDVEQLQQSTPAHEQHVPSVAFSSSMSVPHRRRRRHPRLGLLGCGRGGN